MTPIYASNRFHYVSEVKRGERLAIFGWKQSRIDDPGQREILLGLHRALAMVKKSVDNELLELKMVKARNNLEKMWMA